MTLETWALTLVILGALCLASLMMCSFKADRTAGRKRRRILRLMWAVFWIAGCVCYTRATSQDSDSYDRSCRAHGGTVQHGYCFKPNSEIPL